MESFTQKISDNPYTNLLWNLPEQKRGIVGVVGGNSQNFRTSVKVAEFLLQKYPVAEARMILPDSLKNKLPDLPNLVLLKSTESGSFADGAEINEACKNTDFNIFIGDFSRNSITEQAVIGALEIAEKPLILTRDTIDLVATPQAEGWLMNDNVILITTLAQLQKLLRAIFYPKMLLLSQSLMQVAEILHKFTLSYPVRIVTLHSGQILIAKDGKIAIVPLENTSYSPLSIWDGTLAAKIAAMNLYNPGIFTEATACALFEK